MHALPERHGIVDDLSAFGSGFGGDPNNMVKLNASKGKAYEFSGLFRRARLYSDYNLLANPNVPTTGMYVYVGPSTAPTSVNWSQMSRAATTSPVMFNTVRRMTDINLTIAPFATFTPRFSYSHGTMEGPTLSGSYTPIGMKNNANLLQYQRNGSDDYMGALDWKPSQKTKISFEMQANHYKSDSYFTLDPNAFVVQEANGTPAYLGNYTSYTPYGVSNCNTTSMGSGNYTSASNYTMITPAATPGGMPVINAACAVITSYQRTLPVRTWTPTETIRLQSSAIKNIVMNGNVHYTHGNSDLVNYIESSQGLNGSVRSAITSGGYASVRRAVFGIDYGLVWQVAPAVSISDQIDYSSVKEPGYSFIPNPATLSTPSTAGNQTINYTGALTPGTGSLPHGNTGAMEYNFYGQGMVSNTATVAWDANARARFSLGYRYTSRKIGQGTNRTVVATTSIVSVTPAVSCDPVCGTVDITQNAGIFNAALHPAKNWDLSGTAEISYDDNALTPVAPRQGQMYRVHSLYRAGKMTSLSLSYSDRERHNNTNNAQDLVKAGTAYNGPLNHVDYARVGSAGVVVTPSERYSIDVNYSYSDVYSATNTCYTNGTAAASTTVTPNVPAVPGAVQVTSSGAPNLCAGGTEWKARDFADAPTNFVTGAISYNATSKLTYNFGYTVSKVSGTRFFPDARDVNGMLASTYQTPFLNMAWTFRPGLIWKAEYNYFGYGEGGPSGAALCSTTPTSSAITAANIVPCSSLPNTAMSGPTFGSLTPRTFHANNVTLGIHYEF
jgi:hypothetical protein